MKNSHTLIAIIIVPIIAAFALSAGFYLMENNISTESPDKNAPFQTQRSLDNNIDNQTDNSTGNGSDQEKSNPYQKVSILAEEKIRPLSGNEKPETVFENLKENSSDLADEIMVKGRSTVFLYEGRGRKAFLILNSVESSEELNFTLKGLEKSQIISSNDSVEKTKESIFMSWNLSEGDVSGAAFLINKEEFRIELEPDFHKNSSIKWVLLSNRSGETQEIALDVNRPLMIDSEN